MISAKTKAQCKKIVLFLHWKIQFLVNIHSKNELLLKNDLTFTFAAVSLNSGS